MIKLSALCACTICLITAFVFGSPTAQGNKQHKEICSQFCHNISCNLIDYRYEGCSCKTPDGCIIQGDIVTLDYPTLHSYVSNITTSCGK